MKLLSSLSIEDNLKNIYFDFDAKKQSVEFYIVSYIDYTCLLNELGSRVQFCQIESDNTNDEKWEGVKLIYASSCCYVVPDGNVVQGDVLVYTYNKSNNPSILTWLATDKNLQKN